MNRAPSDILDGQMDDLLAKARRRLLRVDYRAEASAEIKLMLWKRYNWIDVVAKAICIAGLLGGVMLPWWLHRGHCTLGDFVVQFGLAVFLPCLWCYLLTAWRDRRELEEFLVFYSLKYRIHWRGLFYFFYLPAIIFGAVAAVIIYL